MSVIDRQGNLIKQNESQDKFLRHLYETNVGRGLLKVFVKPFISKIAGFVLNTRLSSLAIKKFVKNNNIDMSEYEEKSYRSYNEFFIRKIKEGKRPVDRNESHFMSPCDSKLSVYQIHKDGRFYIKDTAYTFYELTRSKELEREFLGGYLLVFRLSVEDYHRYSYVDDGIKTDNIVINGFYHTVNPIANDNLPIYKENQREYSILRSKHFDNILMMEVGAMMVGKIVNYHQEALVKRGEEKGRFEFGGSTVILAVKKNIISIDQDILYNSGKGIETKVRLGERIAERVH